MRAAGVVEGDVGADAAAVRVLDATDVPGKRSFGHHLLPLHELAEARQIMPRIVTKLKVAVIALIQLNVLQRQ